MAAFPELQRPICINNAKLSRNTNRCNYEGLEWNKREKKASSAPLCTALSDLIDGSEPARTQKDCSAIVSRTQAPIISAEMATSIGQKLSKKSKMYFVSFAHASVCTYKKRDFKNPPEEGDSQIPGVIREK